MTGRGLRRRDFGGRGWPPGACDHVEAPSQTIIRKSGIGERDTLSCFFKPFVVLLKKHVNPGQVYVNIRIGIIKSEGLFIQGEACCMDFWNDSVAPRETRFKWTLTNNI